jgi:hypothetical protein
MAVEFFGRHFEWTFLLAMVNFAILGAEFVKHFNIVVDLAANQILDAISLQRPAVTDMPPGSRGFLPPSRRPPPPSEAF